MRTLTFGFNDGMFRSLVAPKDSAAWTLIISESQGKAMMLFRMKRRSERSMLTALEAAKDERPALTWHSVSSLPWSETTGGVEDDEPYYYKLDFVMNKGEWTLLVPADNVNYLNAQRDFYSSPAQLSKTLAMGHEELSSALAILAGQTSKEKDKGTATK
jgi:hypothetical protein